MEQRGVAMVQCPLNEHHFVPEVSLKGHVERCTYSSLGIDTISPSFQVVSLRILFVYLQA